MLISLGDPAYGSPLGTPLVDPPGGSLWAARRVREPLTSADSRYTNICSKQPINPRDMIQG